MPPKRYSAEEVCGFMDIYREVISLSRFSYLSPLGLASIYDYNPNKLETLLAQAETLPEELRSPLYARCRDMIKEAWEELKRFRDKKIQSNNQD